MLTLHINFNNRIEYYPLSSLWAANLISINFLRRNPKIHHIHIVDNETGEVLKTYYQK